MTIEAGQSGLPFTATLTVQRPAGAAPRAAEAPTAVALRAEAAGARAEATGRILQPRMLRGASFDIRVAVPDMLALAAILLDCCCCATRPSPPA